jgi:hypothetical protein
MLKLIGIYSKFEGELVVDPYVPIKFKAYTGVLIEPYRWRVGDFSKSLFEITIERSTGIVRGATLTLPGSAIGRTVPAEYRQARHEEGLPIVDTAELNASVTDETGEFSVSMNGDQLVIVFDRSIDPETVVGDSRVGFFVGHNLICGAGFFELSREEKELLKGQLIPPLSR